MIHLNWLFLLQNILDMVNKNQVVVISGETGCGKTTQVIVFLKFQLKILDLMVEDKLSFFEFPQSGYPEKGHRTQRLTCPIGRVFPKALLLVAIAACSLTLLKIQ